MTTITGTQSPAPQSAAAKAGAELDEQFQQFLTLLTAQISNQDPLKPMDSTQFVSQLAQLSQVEQTVKTNANLESILGELTQSSTQADLALIGREVTVESASATLSGGKLDHRFAVASEAALVTAEIMSLDGQLVRSVEMKGVAPGALTALDWDGTDSLGLPVPDGKLEVRLTAKDAEGQDVAVTGYGQAKVEGVTFTGTGSRLDLDTGAAVDAGAVLAVR